MSFPFLGGFREKVSGKRSRKHALLQAMFPAPSPVEGKGESALAMIEQRRQGSAPRGEGATVRATSRDDRAQCKAMRSCGSDAAGGASSISDGSAANEAKRRVEAYAAVMARGARTIRIIDAHIIGSARDGSEIADREPAGHVRALMTV